MNEAFDHVGELGGAFQELERLVELLLRRGAAVEVVIHRQDCAPVLQLKLALQLA
ncbi:MAG: hypothetical protein HYW10_02780 [Candidatus Omnitrophica bacterium]|nr:hypothetical protein [Candidatus Omnitrophota bacterium]